MKITSIHSRQILDSRGQPTIECSVQLANGLVAVASVPSGASVGRYEALELRDGDRAHFNGKGVTKALDQVNTVIAPMFMGKEPDIISMDQAMIACDGTHNKSKLGANAILAASFAILRAQALVEGIELYALINKLWQFETPVLPVCMFNVINGGLHADSGLALQEFMIMPRAETFSGCLEMADGVYQSLKQLLQGKYYSTAIGDEGGFAPVFTQQGRDRERAAFELLQQAIDGVGGTPIDFCIDVAASHFYDAASGMYRLHDELLDVQTLIDWYQQLYEQYPIVSLEDALDQDDWSGWRLLTDQLGASMQLVADDLFVTNPERIKQGIEQGVASAVLIKPNQIGTISETIQAIQLCKKAGYKTIISHRSGETNDDFIADLAVGTAASQLKAGAPVRGERVAKYNRLLAIEEFLG